MVLSNEDICVSCGRYIPEGRMVCPSCEKDIQNSKNTMTVMTANCSRPFVVSAEYANKFKSQKINEKILKKIDRIVQKLNCRNEVDKMRCAVELNSAQDVARFTDLVQSVDVDVRLIGKDEHGNPWELSAKSLLCSLLLSAKLQKDREHTAHDVDWNTIYCECEKDIYSLIKDFVR